MIKFNSKIYIKGEKEPYIVSEKVAIQIDKAFKDPNISGLTVLSGHNHSFLKETIKRVVILGDREVSETDDERSIHYVIFNPKKNAIWQGIYPTFEAAKAEYDLQVLGNNGKTNGWIIKKFLTIK